MRTIDFYEVATERMSGKPKILSHLTRQNYE